MSAYDGNKMAATPSKEYSYDDFLQAAEREGLLGEFSEYDLATAKQYPEFGLSMLTLKSDIHKANTQAAKELIHTQAENLRKRYGSYTGGRTGSGYVAELEDGQHALQQMQDYGDYQDTIARPSYTNQYQSAIQDALSKVTNREAFSWSEENDPSYSAYAKQYRREGERATANALAQSAAATGGQVSTAAMTAATQAGDYYGAQLSDKIPELYENAYQRYLQEFSMDRQKLSELQNQEQTEYNKYLNDLSQYNTDRNFDYGLYTDKYNRLNTLREAGLTQKEFDYGVSQNEQATAQSQVDSMLAAGGTPSASLLMQAGYSQEYADAMAAYYKAQNAKGSSSGSGSGSGSGKGNDDSDTTMDYAGLFAAAKASGYPKSFIANNYRKYGFTSTSGLYNEYEGWLETDETPAGSDGESNLVSVPGYGEITWDDAEKLEEQGLIKATLDKNGNVQYVLIKQNSENVALSR